jgi:hypothetical protein
MLRSKNITYIVEAIYNGMNDDTIPSIAPVTEKLNTLGIRLTVRLLFSVDYSVRLYGHYHGIIKQRRPTTRYNRYALSF